MWTVPIEIRVPTTADLLEMWERGRADVPARALLLLGATVRADSARELTELALGARNRLLLRARAVLFGSSCEVVADCVECGTELESSLPVLALVSDSRPAGSVRALDCRGYQVRYRLPTGADVVGLPGAVSRAALELLGRCVVDATVDGCPIGWTELPADVTDRLDQAMRDGDPDALIEVELICPTCGNAQLLPLEPAGFLWTEVDAWAWRVLGEVHQLALAYGWEQDNILALSPARRQTYLQLCGVGA
ncbi:MAG TPA: hypothetical protein VFC16_08980 [Nakamurella sp.]|nr:hypothetical protein [Nakamurella sp.]